VSRPCRLILSAFLLLYLAALALLGIGTFGLFGSERDPLAAVFLAPLGLPWNLLIDFFPDALHPWLGVAAPLVNLLVVWLICRAIRGGGAAREQT
jgi:hypothetical protein